MCLAGGHEFNSERYGLGGLPHSLLLPGCFSSTFPEYFENDRIYSLFVDPTYLDKNIQLQLHNDTEMMKKIPVEKIMRIYKE